MPRKSIVYRRLWYARRRNSARIHVILRLLAVMSVLVLSYCLFSYSFLPELRRIAESDIRDAYTAALRESAISVFSHGPEYKSILSFESSANGDISAISLDKSILEAMTDELLQLTDRKMGLPEAGSVRVSLAGPGGVFFSPGGILDFTVDISQNTKTVVDYLSEYVPVNGGQTKMIVSLAAEAEIHYKASFLEGSTKVMIEMPVGEYIIFGRLPEEIKDPEAKPPG